MLKIDIIKMEPIGLKINFKHTEDIYLKDFDVNTFMTKNPFLIFIITTILAIGIAYVFYKKGNLKKEISYIASSYNIIKHGVGSHIKGKNSLNKIEILFNNENIPDLSITKIAFWNSGNIAIDENDIVKVSPYFIRGNEQCLILAADITTETDVTNQFRLELKDNCVSVKFDYMNSKDGIVIQLVHTGDRDMLKYEGKIKGGKDLCEAKSRDSLYTILLNKIKDMNEIVYIRFLESVNLFTRLFFMIYFVVLALLIDYALFIDTSSFNTKPNIDEYSFVFAIGIVLNILAILQVLLFIIRNKKRVPKLLLTYNQF